jgi:hypothetical protein
MIRYFYGVEVFFHILAMLNRRTELTRLCQWAARKRLKHAYCYNDLSVLSKPVSEDF